jgi:methyl-accepting chemotaxis protein
MQDIRRVLHAAARRLLVVSMLERVVWTLTLAFAGLAVFIMVDRVLGYGLTKGVTGGVLALLTKVGLGAVGAAVAAGVLWALLARKREAAVARIVDERAGLRESLSTALCVEREQDPWSRAVVESAQEKARRVVVRDAIPIEGPGSWPMPTAAAALLVLTFFLMPTLDLRGKQAEARAAEQARQEMQIAEQDAREAEQQIREIMQKTGLSLDDELPDAELEADIARPKAAEDLRKDAIRRLTKANEALGKKLAGEEAKTLEGLKDMMRRLTTPGQGELGELARELSRGNFSKARQELEKLAEKLDSGEMSAEQKEQVAKQMQNLGEQLQQLAEQKDALEQALQQAGVSPEQAKQMASSAQAMQEALQQNQSMSEEQKQQMQQMAQAMQQAASQCQGMGQAMSQMAASMSQGGQPGQQGMDSMSSQLSAMEMMQSDMQSMSDAMSQCQSQMAKLGQCNGTQGWGQCQGDGPGNTGPWKPGSSMSQGSGSGGPGKGNGEGPDAQATDVMFEKQKANVQNQGGPIIGSRYVFGEQIKGEASAEFGAAIQVAADEADEEIQNMNVDPQYRELVKHYYGRLGERVKTEQAVTPPTDGAGADGSATKSGG